MRHRTVAVLACTLLALAGLGRAFAQEPPPDGTPDIHGTWMGKAHAMEFHLSGGIWDYLVNLDFGLLGGIIIGIFIACWAISTIIYKVKRYDDIEVKIAPKAEKIVI